MSRELRYRAVAMRGIQGFTLVAVLTALGCVSPIVSGPGYFGVGLYRDENRELCDDVVYRCVEGVGLLTIDGQLVVGYVDDRRVVGALEGADYAVVTPPMGMGGGDVIEFAVGPTAERWANGEDVFVSPPRPEQSEQIEHEGNK